jgi:hypothetical protein
MKTLVRYSRGRLLYTGRVAKTSFAEWTDSPPGRPVLERVASGVRFAPLGRAWAARSRMWRQLTSAVGSGTATAAIQRELDAYLARLETLAFASDLPRVGIDLHRLVVVPRLFANGEACRRIEHVLRLEPTFAALDGGQPLREWFAVRLVGDIAAAIAARRPSIKHPVPAGNGWITVGVNERFEWRIPFDGPAWPGHYFVLEVTREPFTRAIRKGVTENIMRLEQSLPSLSRAHRLEILRQAGLSLDQLFARA